MRLGDVRWIIGLWLNVYMSTHILEPKLTIFFYVFSQRNLSKESYGSLAKANPNIALFGTFKSSVPMVIFGVEIKSALRQEKSFYIVKMALFGTFKSSVPTEGTNVLCIVPNID
jgi:surface polysaccharide O-acyltransferase-like enzyme